MYIAPIALFVYARLEHTRKTIEALKSNQGAELSTLFIFADGAKNKFDTPQVLEVRNYLHSITGFAKVIIFESDTNLGLANSVINGVTTVLKIHDRIIIVEDDLVTSPYFLNYMNSALNIYALDDDVASVSGYVYPSIKIPPEDETFFLNYAECWGWGTWSRVWEFFEPNANILLEQIKIQQLEGKFNIDGGLNYMRMLKQQSKGKIDSWAIRFYASTFLRGKLTLFPRQSLVTNIGFDGSGQHCTKDSNFPQILSANPIAVNRIRIKESVKARSDLMEALQNNYRLTLSSIFKKIYFKLFKYWKNVF